MKHTAVSTLLVACVTLSMASCGKKEDEGTATGEATVPGVTVGDKAKIRLSVAPLATLRKAGAKLSDDGTLSLVDAATQEGLGHFFSLAQVDGLKVKLHSVHAGLGKGGRGPQVTVFDWSKSPKEVEIKNGLNESLKDEGSLPPGSYDYFNVEVQNGYALKAYAYHDVDKNGAIDAADDLVYTSKAGVKRVAGNLVASEQSDYDYFQNSFLYSHMSTKDGTSTAGFMNMLAEPLVVKKGDQFASSILIDSYRVVGSFNGRLGANSGFPESWGPFNSANVGAGKAWADDKPAFALQYLPMYVFLKAGGSADADAGLRAESYVLSTDAAFPEKALQLATFIFDSTGKPYAASSAIADGSDSPHIGAKIALFEKEAAGTWSFHDGGSIRKKASAAEAAEGGFSYNPKNAELAMHKITGFKFLDTVGDDSSAKIENKPGCWSEYRYCFPYDNKQAASPNDGPGSGTGEAGDTSKFDLFYKRVK